MNNSTTERIQSGRGFHLKDEPLGSPLSGNSGSVPRPFGFVEIRGKWNEKLLTMPAPGNREGTVPVLSLPSLVVLCTSPHNAELPAPFAELNKFMILIFH